MRRRIFVNDDILLKEIDRDDILPIFTTIDTQRDYLGEWLPFIEFTRELTDTEEFVEFSMNMPEKDLTCSIYFRGEFAGLIGLKDTDLINRRTEIGYWLSEPFQGKGIITKSCQALIDYAFETMSMNRIQLKAVVENDKSRRVAERLGFSAEGVERDGELHSDGFWDLQVYSLLRSEYKCKKQQ